LRQRLAEAYEAAQAVPGLAATGRFLRRAAPPVLGITSIAIGAWYVDAVTPLVNLLNQNIAGLPLDHLGSKLGLAALEGMLTYGGLRLVGAGVTRIVKAPKLEKQNAKLREELEIARQANDNNVKEQQVALKARADALDKKDASITKREENLATARETLNADKAQLKADQKKLSDLKKEHKVDKQATTKQAHDLAKRASELDAREKSLDAIERDLNTKEKNLDARKVRLDSRKRGLDERKRDLDDRTRGLDDREEELRQLDLHLQEAQKEESAQSEEEVQLRTQDVLVDGDSQQSSESHSHSPVDPIVVPKTLLVNFPGASKGTETLREQARGRAPHVADEDHGHRQTSTIPRPKSPSQLN
jgi:hypothetical protein